MHRPLGALFIVCDENIATEHASICSYSKTCVKQPLSKRPKIVFQDQLSFNADQKYCRMLQGGLSAILSTFSKLPFVIKIFVLPIFKWPLRHVLLNSDFDLSKRIPQS